MTCPCCAEGFATRYGHRCPDCGSTVDQQRIAAKQFHKFSLGERALIVPRRHSGDSHEGSK